MKQFYIFFTIATTIVLATAFQNCSRISFTQASETLESLQISDTTVHGKLNTPVKFTLPSQSKSKLTGAILRLFIESGNPKAGAFEIIDANTLSLKFMPAVGYRGRFRATVTVADQYENKKVIEVNIVVGNPFVDLEPALAVRATGCVSCHAAIKSNFITDLGNGGDEANSRNYLMNFKPNEIYPQRDSKGAINAHPSWTAGLYGNHVFGLNTLNMDASKKIFVPKVTLPSALSSQIQDYLSHKYYEVLWPTRFVADYSFSLAKPFSASSTLADYVNSMLANGDHYQNSVARPVVTEAASVRIGAPTSIQIMSAFAATTERTKFFRDSDSSPDIAGFIDQGSFFENDQVLDCDGDLMVQGTLLLENLKLRTISGCRIYVTGSVFIYGPIVYLDFSGENSTNKNLQITSARSINMGLGRTIKTPGADLSVTESYCDSGDAPYNWYSLRAVDVKAAQTQNWANFGDSFYVRQFQIQGSEGFVRGFSTASNLEKFLASITTEYKNLTVAKGSNLLDSSCEKSRKIAFDHLLLNAPIVQSRYTGDISGSIITEVPLMALGQFSFSYDTVFSRVAILPFLDSAILLDVQK